MLFVLLFVLRFWPLPFPIPVFDEIHFVTYASQYLKKQFYLDVHPPLGKLFWAGILKLFNLSVPPSFSFASPVSFFWLRYINVLLSLFLALVLSLLGKEFLPSPLPIFLTLFFLLETALFLESKLVLLNILLLLFIFLSFYLATLAVRKRSLFLLLGSAIAATIAFNVKFTGLGAWILSLWYLLLFYPEKRVVSLIVFVFSLLFISFLVWSFHTILLSNSCLPECPFVLQGIVRFLGESFLEPPTGSFVSRLFVNVARVFYFNRFFYIASFGSDWYALPFGLRPVPYYFKAEEKTALLLFPNLPLWWFGLAGQIGFVLSLIKGKKDKKAFVLFAGTLLFWVPLAFVQRFVMLYHYFPSLIFSWILALRVFSHLSLRSLYALLLLSLVFFLLVSPVLLGLPTGFWTDWIFRDSLFGLPSFYYLRNL